MENAVIYWQYQKLCNTKKVYTGAKMKNKKLILAVLIGSILMLLMAGCGPKGGTLILLNESSYELDSPRISMGDHSQLKLNPGESMKSIVDKNSRQFNVSFKMLKEASEKVVVDGIGGNWSPALPLIPTVSFTSSAVSVNDGETVIITVKNDKNKL